MKEEIILRADNLVKIYTMGKVKIHKQRNSREELWIRRKSKCLLSYS
ncbi:MAG: hypothetical protein J7L07_09010 [Candidatus Odinarchaeota archaeon]|nr:hypothetical protein [Candidatus Odinarchaeota archaeon]